MKHITIIFISFCILYTSTIKADEKNILHNSWSFLMGEERIADTYLSPLEYKGISYNLVVTHASLYNKNISWEVNHTWKYSSLINPAYTSLINHLSLEVGYNTLYNWELFKNFTIATGGSITTHGGLKYLSRNVNNPTSADILATINALLKAKYIVETKPVNILFEYSIYTPLFGAMFIPEYAQPYYDIYENMPESLNKTILFSSFHNNHGANGTLNIDLAFNGFTLRTTFNHNHMFWNGNGLNFYQKNLSGGIGVILNTTLFWGKKH